MKRTLWNYCISNAMLLFLAVATAAFMFAWFRVQVVGVIDTGRFRQIIELLPDDWQRFTNVDFEWMVSYLGRTALTFDEPMLQFLIVIWALTRGSDVVSGALGRGTLELILSQPISRKRYYWTHTATSIIGLGLISLTVWLGMWIAVQTAHVKESVYPSIGIPGTCFNFPLTFLKAEELELPMSHFLHGGEFFPGVINMFCLGVFLIGMTTFLSSLDRYRWRTLGIAIAICFLSAVAKLGSMTAESMKFMQYFTFFSLYEPALHIQHNHEVPYGQFHWISKSEGAIVGLGPLGCNALLVFMGIGLLFWGAKIFHQRDLPAPV